MSEITLRKCKECGIMYPADEKHRCNVLVKKAYQQGRADAYIECMRIISECVWKDAEMLEKMIAEQLKEQN